jgi:hypothetical protein
MGTEWTVSEEENVSKAAVCEQSIQNTIKRNISLMEA